MWTNGFNHNCVEQAKDIDKKPRRRAFRHVKDTYNIFYIQKKWLRHGAKDYLIFVDIGLAMIF
jgi:hypothetical protein